MISDWQLQPEIVMEPGGGMFLDDVAQAFGGGRLGCLAARLGADGEIAHRLVFGQGFSGGFLPCGHGNPFSLAFSLET